MQKPTFYTLIFFKENGEQQFGGAFVEPAIAEIKGQRSGKSYKVRPVFVG